MSTQGYIVVRKERHVDDKYWIFVDKVDALTVAKIITASWKEFSGLGCDYDEKLYGDQLFHCSLEDGFSIEMFPVTIKQKGDIEVEKN